MKNEKKDFRIDPVRPTAVAAMLAFACCIPAQILGYAGCLKDLFVVLTLVFLPVLSASLKIPVNQFQRIA